MCTTYLMARIVEEKNSIISGYPRLVRLNPNIPYRTRGNGALSARLGTGRRKVRVGFSGDQEILTSVHENDAWLSAEDTDYLWNLVKEFSEPGEKTNPGMVIGEPDRNGEFYRLAVKREVSMEYSTSYIGSSGARIMSLGNGRGIIGAYASISWPAERQTYEVISYSYPKAGMLEKNIMVEAASYAESFDFTFDSMDYRNSHPGMFPSPRTPVIYGIRGTDPDRLLDLAGDVNERFGIKAERYLVFRTNQGTDDHIMDYSGELNELSSYRIHGRLETKPEPITGGHYFSLMKSAGRAIKIAAFEPTKEFRSLFSALIPGDEVEVFGSYLDGTINVEKLRVISLASSFTRAPPKCHSCGTAMKTRGRFSYVCRKCGNVSTLPSYVPNSRKIKPGFYEVPVCARRHLSAPLVLIGRDVHA